MHGEDLAYSSFKPGIKGTVQEIQTSWYRPYAQLVECGNSLVMSWLINSMQPQIFCDYLLLDSGHKILNVAFQTYSQVGTDEQIYEL